MEIFFIKRNRNRYRSREKFEISIHSLLSFSSFFLPGSSFVVAESGLILRNFSRSNFPFLIRKVSRVYSSPAKQKNRGRGGKDLSRRKITLIEFIIPSEILLLSYNGGRICCTRCDDISTNKGIVFSAIFVLHGFSFDIRRGRIYKMEDIRFSSVPKKKKKKKK